MYLELGTRRVYFKCASVSDARACVFSDRFVFANTTSRQYRNNNLSLLKLLYAIKFHFETYKARLFS